MKTKKRHLDAARELEQFTREFQRRADVYLKERLIFAHDTRTRGYYDGMTHAFHYAAYTLRRRARGIRGGK